MRLQQYTAMRLLEVQVCKKSTAMSLLEVQMCVRVRACTHT